MNDITLSGFGYSEQQFSLPRWEDLSISRQSMFEDSNRLIPTAGWMFVPLTAYHKPGADIVFEPLSKHIVEYEWYIYFTSFFPFGFLTFPGYNFSFCVQEIPHPKNMKKTVIIYFSLLCISCPSSNLVPDYGSV